MTNDFQILRVSYDELTGDATEPASWQDLPRYKGLPVGFMFHVDGRGVPDFKVIEPAKVAVCIQARLCGLCGWPLEGSPVDATPGRAVVTGGPQTTRNHVCGDPAMHEECATWAFVLCPFLRRDTEYSKESHRMQAQGVLAESLVMVRPDAMHIMGVNPKELKLFRGHQGEQLIKTGPWLWATIVTGMPTKPRPQSAMATMPDLIAGGGYRTWPYGTTKRATVLETRTTKVGTVQVVEDTDREAHILVGAACVDERALPGHTGTLTFTKGGPTGGYWSFCQDPPPDY